MTHEQRRALIRRLRGATSIAEETRPLSDERPAPAPGDMVGYRVDPELYGAMLMLPHVDGRWCACEVNPPSEIPDGYEPDVAYFRLEELEHADVLWKSGL